MIQNGAPLRCSEAARFSAAGSLTSLYRVVRRDAQAAAVGSRCGLGVLVLRGSAQSRIVCASFEQRNCNSIDVSGDRYGGPVSRGFGHDLNLRV